MDMNSDGSWGGDQTGLGGSDAGRHDWHDRHDRHDRHDQLDRLLADWGTDARGRPGLNTRVWMATASTIARTGTGRSARASHWWGAGLAVAASIVAALFIGVVPDSARDGIDVATADRIDVPSEAVLVSLLAGSEVIEGDDPAASELLAADAMPLLRARDATYRDIHSEISGFLALGGGK